MRDYSKVSGAFWTGKTGKSLRGDHLSQTIAFYLMTSPHSNMIGVFYCPISYIAHDIGSSFEGASESLKKLCEGGFCTYDEDAEMVWVHEMARFQIGDSLKPTDNRVIDIQKQYSNLAESLIKTGFYARYKDCFHLKQQKEKASPSKAPSQVPLKPETGTETGTEGKPIVRSEPAPFDVFWETWPKSPRKVGKAACEKKWNTKELDAIAEQIIEHVTQMKKTKQWQDGFEPAPMTYINQGRWADEIFDGNGATPNTKPWYISSTGIEAKAVELGITKERDELFPDFKVRVYQAAGITPDMVRQANIDFGQKK